MVVRFKTVEPMEYYRRFLKENCHTNGREFGKFRTTTVNIVPISTTDGSALVKLGNTTVVYGVKAEFAKPPTDTQVANQFIANVTENSQIIQKEDFCVSSGKLPWFLYCDLICLDYDGNILDACTFALSVALKNVKTALAEVNLKKKGYLNIRTHPVVTFIAMFDGTLLIVDCTGEEEHLAIGNLTIIMDEEGKLCCFHKPGGSGLTGAKFQDSMNHAVTRHKEVKQIMEEVINSMKPKKKVTFSKQI
ncbi:EXOSC8-like [Ictidomys tridecemlineatus]|uniref:Ribosomal RNA-processing protein 43 n=1 Tax=Ictidomys tridecemlineatus TaxID=43179 RepID=A0A287DA01_ICTTR|nr:EXOSC8-like [Ictidomys tridecemlineatus]